MARNSSNSFPAHQVLLWISAIFSILILLGVSSDGQRALASYFRVFKLATWSQSLWQTPTSENHALEIESTQHAVPKPAQGALHVTSIIYEPGSIVSLTRQLDGFGHQNLRSAGGNLQTNADPQQLAERGLFDSTYTKNSKKGKLLLCYLVNPANAGAKAGTQWINFGDLKKSGWSPDRKSADYNHIRKSFGDSNFASMDFSKGTNMVWTHDTTVTVNGVKYHATNAVYNNVFWPTEGIIFANDNHNPESRIKAGEASVEPWKDDKGRPLPIVKLKQWSDIAFLTWQSLTSTGDRQKLKWVFRRNIINQMTVNMISEVMKKNNIPGVDGNFKGTKLKQAPVWPGFKLEAGDGGFEALVGSPNSYGVCWMLIQHQAEMGHKTIKSIRVIDEDTKGISYAPTMIMEIDNAPHELYEGT